MMDLFSARVFPVLDCYGLSYICASKNARISARTPSKKVGSTRKHIIGHEQQNMWIFYDSGINLAVQVD